jgi:fructose-1,6-bisphosphatase/inositol monophosphatase family enzyme
MAELLESLGELLKEVSEREILPRFRRLSAGDIISKATPSDPDDLVTVADREAEAFLTERLPKLLPGSLVVGEEAAAKTPSVLNALDGDHPVWLVDPVDGTKNFASGVGPFGVMVALVERGESLLSGIYLPLEHELYLARRGSGATLNGERLTARPAGSALFTGTLYTRFMPQKVIESLNPRPENVRFAESPQCAAFEYARLARGDRDFALYYRLFPWDHVPGALLVREAGGVARRPGEPGVGDYGARDKQPLLLVAPDEARWQAVWRALTEPTRPAES